MAKGVIKFFNKEKGYGFVIEAESKQEIFMTISSLKGKVQDGDLVDFKIKNNNRGFKAVKVKVICQY